MPVAAIYLLYSTRTVPETVPDFSRLTGQILELLERHC